MGRLQVMIENLQNMDFFSGFLPFVDLHYPTSVDHVRTSLSPDDGTNICSLGCLRLGTTAGDQGTRTYAPGETHDSHCHEFGNTIVSQLGARAIPGCR